MASQITCKIVKRAKWIWWDVPRTLSVWKWIICRGKIEMTVLFYRQNESLFTLHHMSWKRRHSDRTAIRKPWNQLWNKTKNLSSFFIKMTVLFYRQNESFAIRKPSKEDWTVLSSKWITCYWRHFMNCLLGVKLCSVTSSISKFS